MSILELFYHIEIAYILQSRPFWGFQNPCVSILSGMCTSPMTSMPVVSKDDPLLTKPITEAGPRRRPRANSLTKSPQGHYKSSVIIKENTTMYLVIHGLVFERWKRAALIGARRSIASRANETS
jgi:hypothetical protein